METKHSVEAFEGLAVEIGDLFEAAKLGQDFGKSRKPGGLGGHGGISDTSLGEDWIRHNAQLFISC